jgi:imidazolonepropionase-like amidohydrolase
MARGCEVRTIRLWIAVASLMLPLHSNSILADTALVVQAKKILTAAGKTIEDGTIVCVDGKIKAVGKTGEMNIPADSKILKCEIVMPGMVDVRTCVGLSGVLNIKADSDQLESSSPLQPELRAIDAYNPREELVEYIQRGKLLDQWN